MLQGENVPANLAQLQCFVQDKGEETLKFYVVFLLGFLSRLESTRESGSGKCPEACARLRSSCQVLYKVAKGRAS